jgi:hypothetical protein
VAGQRNGAWYWICCGTGRQEDDSMKQ